MIPRRSITPPYKARRHARETSARMAEVRALLQAQQVEQIARIVASMVAAAYQLDRLDRFCDEHPPVQ